MSVTTLARWQRTILPRPAWLLWLIVVLSVAMVLLRWVVVVGFGEHPVNSFWEPVGTPLRWVLLVLGIMLAPAFLPTYVALGLTRRRFTVHASYAGGLLVALVTGWIAVGFLVERAVFAVAGHDHTLIGEHLFSSAGQVHLVIVEYALVCAAYLVSGWVVGAGYYRFGGLVGTLLLPVGFAPLVAVENLLSTGRWTGLGDFSLSVPTLPAVALGLLAVALGGLGGYLLIRSAAIGPPKNR